MTDRPHEDPPVHPYDDRTRNISLPPLPGRPPPSLPREWAGLAAQPSAASGAPDVSTPPPETATSALLPPPAPSPAPVPAPAGEWSDRTSLADQPTDEVRRPRGTPREATIRFSEPEMVHRPAGPVRVDRMPRRWPWVVLFVVPVLVIAAAGITLLVLLRAG